MKWILLLVFVVVQILAFVFVWVVRYHFRLFSLPHDRRGSILLLVMTIGTATLFLVSAILLGFFFVHDPSFIPDFNLGEISREMLDI